MRRRLRCRHRLSRALAAGLSRGATLWFGCLLLLHSPDGTQLEINSQNIMALRPAAGVTEHHLAKGTQTIVYMTGKVFGVAEGPLQIADMIKQCEEQQP